MLGNGNAVNGSSNQDADVDLLEDNNKDDNYKLLNDTSRRPVEDNFGEDKMLKRIAKIQVPNIQASKPNVAKMSSAIFFRDKESLAEMQASLEFQKHNLEQEIQQLNTAITTAQQKSVEIKFQISLYTSKLTQANLSNRIVSRNGLRSVSVKPEERGLDLKVKNRQMSKENKEVR